MRVDQAVNIEDLHRLAKRRLPKVAFDFIEGGLEDERGLDRNTAAFHKRDLLPRYLVDVSKRDQSQTIFGKKFNSPFGISPTGGAGLFRRGADLMLAEAAAEANIPYIMSGSSNDSMESAARVAPNNAWYQLYAARDGAIAVTALEPHFRVRLYEGLGLADGDDPSAIFSTKTAIEWEQWASARDLPLVAIREPSFAPPTLLELRRGRAVALRAKADKASEDKHDAPSGS